LHILGEMGKAIGSARTELGEYAPRIETIKIPVDKIREVIGSGGSVIREIVAESGAKIDIEDDGTVRVASANRESIEKALGRIRGITQEPEIGQIYRGKVVKIMEFGAFVNFFGSKDGLVHISQLTQGRPATVGEVVKEGQEVYVKLLGFDDRGKVRLSMKIIDQATGKELPPEQQQQGGSEGGGGGGNGGDRGPRRDRGEMRGEGRGDRGGDRGGDRPPRRDRGAPGGPEAAGGGGDRPPRRERRPERDWD
jgi:polyribonucleotide nucleotidyltransferase